MSNSRLSDDSLKEALRLVLIEMQKKGLLKNVDSEKLLNDTLENIKGEITSPSALKDPEMKLKLATALVATFTYGKEPNKFDFQQLFKPVNDPQPQMEKMMVDYFEKLRLENQQTAAAEASAFMKLLKTFEPPTPKPQPGSKPQEEKEDFIFAAVYDDTGHVIDILEGVNVSKKDLGKARITLSEMVWGNLQIENNDFVEKTEEAFHDQGHLYSAKNKLTPPGQ